MREVVLVGVEQNTTHTIDTHDVYTLGQFKDDQFQNHSHPFSRGLLDNRTNGDTRQSGSGDYISGALSRTNQADNGRRGTTTHGKQFGVNYVIKY